MRKLLFAGTAALLGLVAGAAHAQRAALDAAALEQWLASYGTAWETRDADAAARLFTSDARYFETPFAEPFAGREEIREYWSNVTANQRDIEFDSDVVTVDGAVGVARWNATFAAGEGGERIELDGVFVLEFDASGRCAELREWWHMRAPSASGD